MRIDNTIINQNYDSMITNVTMSRPMGELTVHQRTKDGLFNATSLLKQYNEKVNTQNSGELTKDGNTPTGNVKKDLDDYLSNKSTKEFIKALMQEPECSGHKPYKTLRGKHGGTWMHPLLFIDFAMWLNPKFKVQVIKFVSDQMLRFRNDAGDAYKDLSCAVNTLKSDIDIRRRMMFVSKAVNCLTFGKHEHDIRNAEGIEDKMLRLFERERHITNLINEGFITTFDALVNYLRNAWIREHNPIANIKI